MPITATSKKVGVRKVALYPNKRKHGYMSPLCTSNGTCEVLSQDFVICTIAAEFRQFLTALRVGCASFSKSSRTANAIS